MRRHWIQNGFKTICCNTWRLQSARLVTLKLKTEERWWVLNVRITAVGSVDCTVCSTGRETYCVVWNRPWLVLRCIRHILLRTNNVMKSIQELPVSHRPIIASWSWRFYKEVVAKGSLESMLVIDNTWWEQCFKVRLLLWRLRHIVLIDFSIDSIVTFVKKTLTEKPGQWKPSESTLFFLKKFCKPLFDRR